MRWRLLTLLLLGACASSEPEDRFEPPIRPLAYRPIEDCPSAPVTRRPRPPSGDLEPPPPLETEAGAVSGGLLVVAHGGVGSPAELSDGPRAAAAQALIRLEAGASALDGVVAGVVVLEDDPRFNAGTGSHIRLDGKTIQMDAAVMESRGGFGAVAAIERVKNPVLVARAVLETPHLLLAGDGAVRFARKLGFPDVYPSSPESEARYKERLQRLRELQRSRGKNATNWKKMWNFEAPMPDGLEHGDTVGVVARDADGHFAAALSTGGTSYTLSGRVGDVPIYGAGGFAGPAGAVACTGDGERIVERGVARSVYALIESGVPAKEAVARTVSAFPEKWALGVIAIDATGWGVAANKSMAYGTAAETEEPE